jgi:hypothetical protein
VRLTAFIAVDSVFFYGPFSGGRLLKVLGDIEVIARTRTIRVCCLDSPLPPCPNGISLVIDELASESARCD